MVPCAVVLGTMLAVGPGSAVECLVEVHGNALKEQLAEQLAPARAHFQALGCGQLSVGFWTVGRIQYHQVQVRVECVDWRWQDPLDPWARKKR